MFKKTAFITVFLIIIFCLPVWSDEVNPSNSGAEANKLNKWEEIYGVDLVNIPLPLRQQFMLATGQAWADATTEEQYGFLDERLGQKKIREKERENWQKQKDKKEKDSIEKERRRQEELRRKNESNKAKKDKEQKEKAERWRKLRRLAEVRTETMRKLRDRDRTRNSK